MKLEVKYKTIPFVEVLYNIMALTAKHSVLKLVFNRRRADILQHYIPIAKTRTGKYAYIN